MIEKFITVTKLDKNKTGSVDANGAVIKKAGEPTDPNDLTTKTYVDELFEKVDKRIEFIANDFPISIRAEKGSSQSTLELSTNNIFIQAAPALDNSNANGASCHISAGNGDGEGNGGDINLVPGIGAQDGEIHAYGSVNINGVLQFTECKDPGEPPINVVYLWFDKKDRLLRARKKGVEDLILI